MLVDKWNIHPSHIWLPGRLPAKIDYHLFYIFLLLFKSYMTCFLVFNSVFYIKSLDFYS